MKLASDLIGKALRGSYPLVVESMQGFAMFGGERQFASATEILSIMEPFGIHEDQLPRERTMLKFWLIWSELRLS